MNKARNRYSSKEKVQEKISIGQFLNKSLSFVTQKSVKVLERLHNKLSQPLASINLTKQQKQSITKNFRIKPKGKTNDAHSLFKNRDALISKQSQTFQTVVSLSEAQINRLKQISKKKQELMQQLKKIDNNFNNKFSDSQISETSRIMKNSQLKLGQSPNKTRNEQAYNLPKHTKALEMLSKINNEKIKRQEQIVDKIKKKQAVEIKNVRQMELQNSRALVENKHLRKAYNPKDRQRSSRKPAIFNTKLEDQFQQSQSRQISLESKPKYQKQIYQKVDTEQQYEDEFS